MPSSFRRLLARAFELVERDAPLCGAAIADRLGALSLAIIVDDEVAIVRSAASRVLVGEPDAAPAVLELRTRSSHLVGLLDGADQVHAAVLANRVRVRTPPEHAHRVFDIVRLLIEGCARSGDAHQLVNDLRRMAAEVEGGTEMAATQDPSGVPWQLLPGDKRRVVVVGAGVAGLTAAHELAERGYEVEVIEAAADSISRRPLVGGMARTSWAEVPEPPDQYPMAEPRSELFTRLYPDLVYPPVLAPYGMVFPAFTGEVLQLMASLDQSHRLSVTVIGKLGKDEEDTLRTMLDVAAVPGRWNLTSIDGPPETAGLLESKPSFQFRIESDRLPGEHGFRFFPSFYRNMFDTMKRIPVEEASLGRSPLVSAAASSDSARRVFDALESAVGIELGLVRRDTRLRSFRIARHPIRSLQELRELLANVLEKVGYRAQDLSRLSTRYLEYLTSSRQRRQAEYERMSWSEFLGLDRGYSDYFVQHVNSGAQALSAMSSKTNDARTIGSVALQLTLDQVRRNESGYTDATLRGPTSLALFGPWQSYLESLGVTFTSATLVGFCGKGMAVRPVFGGFLDDDARQRGLYNYIPVDPADYYVITVPIDKFQRLFIDRKPAFAPDSPGAPRLIGYDELAEANRLCLELDQLEGRLSGISPADRDDLQKYIAFPVGDYTAHPDAGPLRYMCGIQFYFDADVKAILGHTVCLDSPWGVSYISQEQYWQDRSRGQQGVRGVLSAIFTRFEVEAVGSSGGNPKTAMACSAEEIADRVWRQIVDSWGGAANGPIPKPRYYYLDENLTQVRGGWTNETPYLINRIDDWEKRGGARTADGDYLYPIQLGHTVFAGAFMRTVTRLNTMEAANETGRRAVNAILDRDHPLSQQVPIYDLEDYEIPELRAACDLDARIWSRGGRHALRSGIAEAVLRAIPWDLVRLGLPMQGEQQ
jgi:uncharacterized protein with NAD-binding domain and iron-sulfur cluster